MNPSVRVATLALCLASCACGDAPAHQAPAPGPATPPIVERAGRTDAPSGAARDLEADERQGGHTLARHVGKSDAELRDRLRRERGISAASSWTDRETAARTVALALGRAQRRIRTWSDREGSRPNLAIDWRGREVVGRSLTRGARSSLEVSCAVVVLRWETRRDDYYVLTSYPEVCR